MATTLIEVQTGPMSTEEIIAELRDEIAHADDLVDRLMVENEALRDELEIVRMRLAEQAVEREALVAT